MKRRSGFSASVLAAMVGAILALLGAARSVSTQGACSATLRGTVLTLEAGLRVSKMPNNRELTGLALRFGPEPSLRFEGWSRKGR